ncbi:F-box protein SKIP23-like protein [Drosera capensis]
MSAGGDWTHLPSDLLHSIAALLDTSTIHTIRFRSVCAAWRAAVPSPPPLLSPHRISSADPFAPQIDGFSLFKRTIPTKPWMIKLEEVEPGSKFRVFSPLVNTNLFELKNVWPRGIDLRDVRVWDLGEEYVLQFVNRVSGRDWDSLYMEKVAFLRRGNGGFVVLTIHISGKLALFRSGESKWVILNDKRLPFDDVIVVDGEFYGVDSTGELVRVRVDDDGVIEGDRLSLVAEPVFGGGKKCLVKSGRDLLLVDVYNGVNRYEDSDGDYIYADEGSHEQLGQNAFWFEVFRWDVDGRKWVRVDRLDGRVLFLNDICAFSACSSDLHWHDDCIWYNFADDLHRGEVLLGFSDIKVFELDSGSTRGI